MEIEEKDAQIQSDNLKVLGFATSVSRRNLILGFLVVSWIATCVCAYKWSVCESEHRITIEQMTAKYETKIDKLSTKYETKIDELYKKITEK